MSHGKKNSHESAKGTEDQNTHASGWRRLLALLALRCPRCLRGPVFVGSTTMNENCPECGYHFERERGNFLGSMYVSYVTATILMLFPMFAIYIVWPELDLGWDALIAAALFAPFVPLTWRYSRVLWMYFDRWAWPENTNP